MADSPLVILLLNHLFFKQELETLGHSVVTAAFQRPWFDLSIDTPGIHLRDLIDKLDVIPDRIVVYDDSAAPWIIGFEEIDIPKVFFAIDLHHHLSWQTHFSNVFDHVFVCQWAFRESLSHPSQEWMPLWAPQERAPKAIRERDVVFRGTMNPELHPMRRAFFDEFAKYLPVDAAEGEWIETYGQAKIVLNQGVSNDLNFRAFEALASGALLLHPRTECGLAELFEEGVHYVAYEPLNAKDAADKARYYLANEIERSKIAERGMKAVLDEHTTVNRALRLHEVLTQLSRRRLPGSVTSEFRAFLPTLVLSEQFGTLADKEAVGRAAAELIEKAANEEAYPQSVDDGGELALVLLSLFSTEQHDRLEKVTRLLETTDRFPELIVFELGALLGKGEDARAKERAEQWSDSPDELIASVPHLIAQMRERLGLNSAAPQ